MEKGGPQSHREGHMNDHSGEGTPGSGIPINLGCSCKQELAVAHKQCAETWFKNKGNKICEICGSLAMNDVCVTETKVNFDDQLTETANSAPTAPTWRRRFWNAFVFSLYISVISNLSNWFLQGERQYIIASFVILFFVLVCEVVDYRMTGNTSISIHHLFLLLGKKDNDGTQE